MKGYFRAFVDDPEDDQMGQCKHSEEHYDRPNEVIRECSQNGLEKNYEELQEYYLALVGLNENFEYESNDVDHDYTKLRKKKRKQRKERAKSKVGGVSLS